MRIPVSELVMILEARLHTIESVANKGVSPGDMDSYELEQLIGRIKELKHVIGFIKETP